MTPEQELEWHRDWRKRLLSEMRRWWKPKDYAAACDAWTNVETILKEQPEQTEGETR
jgi:hypothetical protein